MLNELIQKIGTAPVQPDAIVVKSAPNTVAVYLGTMCAPSAGIPQMYGRWVYARKDAAKEQVAADALLHLLSYHGLPRERDTRSADQWRNLFDGLKQIVDGWNVVSGYRQNQSDGSSHRPNLDHATLNGSLPHYGPSVSNAPQGPPQVPQGMMPAPPQVPQGMMPAPPQDLRLPLFPGNAPPPPMLIPTDPWGNPATSHIGEMIRALELWQTHVAQGQIPPNLVPGQHPPGSNGH
jgi:hypothetical protein